MANSDNGGNQEKGSLNTRRNGRENEASASKHAETHVLHPLRRLDLVVAAFIFRGRGVMRNASTGFLNYVIAISSPALQHLRRKTSLSGHVCINY